MQYYSTKYLINLILSRLDSVSHISNCEDYAYHLRAFDKDEILDKNINCINETFKNVLKLEIIDNYGESKIVVLYLHILNKHRLAEAMTLCNFLIKQ